MRAVLNMFWFALLLWLPFAIMSRLMGVSMNSALMGSTDVAGEFKYMPGVFDENWLPGFADSIIRGCGKEREDDVRKFIAHFGVTVEWSSGCSGTDSPTWCMAALREVLDKRGVQFDPKHLYSAELLPRKRLFIEKQQHGPPMFLFPDVLDLSRPSATCTRIGKSTDPRKFRPRMFIVGFSCKGASGLNTKQVGSVFGKPDVSTAITLSATWCVLDEQSPDAFVAENVYSSF